MDLELWVRRICWVLGFKIGGFGVSGGGGFWEEEREKLAMKGVDGWWKW